MNSESAKQRLERVKKEREARKRKEEDKKDLKHSRTSSSIRRQTSRHSDEKKAKEQQNLDQLNEDLRQVLIEIGLEHYASVFFEHDIVSKQQLFGLSDADLKSVGVSGRSRAKIFEHSLRTSTRSADRGHSLASASEPIIEPASTLFPKSGSSGLRFLSTPAVDLFKRFDADSSGTISLSELQDALAEGGFEFSEQQLSLLILSVDSDSNGNLDLEEFVELFEHLNLLETSYECEILTDNKVFDKKLFANITQDLGFRFDETQMRVIYEFADEDKSGTIDREEFLTVGLFLRLCRSLFRQADLDKSGTLEFNEVYRIIPILLPHSVSTEKFVVRSIFNSIDSDKDNQLTLEEFVHLVATIKE